MREHGRAAEAQLGAGGCGKFQLRIDLADFLNGRGGGEKVGIIQFWLRQDELPVRGRVDAFRADTFLAGALLICGHQRLPGQALRLAVPERLQYGVDAA